MRLITKHILISSLLLLNTACAVQQLNGNNINLEQPFLLSDQNWRINKKLTAENGDRVCTISSGELAVTQSFHEHSVVLQVGTLNELNPGDSYKILAGPNNYETLEGWFDQKQSQDIIKSIMYTNVIYTETRESTIELGHAGPGLRSINNKIPMAGFANQYHACENFVKSASQK